MIDYATYQQIHQLAQQGLHDSQIAASLQLDSRTVAQWRQVQVYQPRQPVSRPSKLDAYRGTIIRLLAEHPYSAIQLLQRLRPEGYTGSYTILKAFVTQVRPRPTEAYLTLQFAPGQCAQVDWGYAGLIKMGTTQRRLSFFIMVLAYSRYLYVEFTLGESLEFWLTAHRHAFEFFGGVPTQIMIDNPKTAVLSHPLGEAAQLQPHYQALARHYGFEVRACTVRQPHQKGMVENAVGYLKKNLLRGWTLPPFGALNPAAKLWLQTVANIRLHAQTHRRPVDLFAEEKPKLQPLPLMPFDTTVTRAVRATVRFRVHLDTNTYSVPAEYAGHPLQLKLAPDQLTLHDQQKLIAEHPRCFDRHQDFEKPEHVRAILQQRKRAQEQRQLMDLLKLAPCAERYYQQLQQRRLDSHRHVKKILALAQIYGQPALAHVMQQALAMEAFSAEYLENLLLQQQEPAPPPPAPLHLTRRPELLNLQPLQPDLAIYDQKLNPPKK
jgi:transposase